MRISNKTKYNHERIEGFIAIGIEKPLINGERYVMRTPYEVLGKWALRGVVIGQAKKPGPMIKLCIINLTHAYNNWQLLGKLSDDYVFGQEHSNNTQDRQQVRKNLKKLIFTSLNWIPNTTTKTWEDL